MASTYTPIATTTLGSASSSITFSSISGSYTDLIVVLTGTAGSNLGVNLQFNGDTNTNYSRIVVGGNGTSASSTNTPNDIAITCGLISTNESNNIFHIMNYSNTTTYKTAIARTNRTDILRAVVGTWRSTSAITSVTLMVTGDTMSIGTTATLYGIKAA